MPLWIISFFAMLHVSAHICDFYWFTHANENEILTLLVENRLLEDIAHGITEPYLLLLRKLAGIMGITMVICLLVAFPLM
jgi:hypothetical protein